MCVEERGVIIRLHLLRFKMVSGVHVVGLAKTAILLLALRAIHRWSKELETPLSYASFCLISPSDSLDKYLSIQFTSINVNTHVLHHIFHGRNDLP